MSNHDRGSSYGSVRISWWISWVIEYPYMNASPAAPWLPLPLLLSKALSFRPTTNREYLPTIRRGMPCHRVPWRNWPRTVARPWDDMGWGGGLLSWYAVFYVFLLFRFVPPKKMPNSVPWQDGSWMMSFPLIFTYIYHSSFHIFPTVWIFCWGVG